MKKIIPVLLLIGLSSIAQVKTDSITVQVDTVIAKKVSSSWYGRTIPISMLSATLQGETLKQRISQNFEIGKSFGMVDIGLALGKVNSITNDSIPKSFNTQFIEAKLTMDACQYGIFSNEITIGAGYMFNNTTPLMLEISSTIFAQVGENWGLGVVYGNYNFTGDSNDVNKTFTGIYFRIGLIRDDGGILLSRSHLKIKKTKKITHHQKT
jgi:hypothetical protein